MALLEIIQALQGVVVFIIGIVLAIGPVEDKSDEKKALIGTVSGIVLISLGTYLFFKNIDAQLAGFAVGFVGFIALLFSASYGIKDVYFMENNERPDGFSDFLIAFVGIVFIIAAIASLVLSTFAVVGIFLGLAGAFLILVGLFESNSNKETTYLFALGIILIVLAISPRLL